MSGDSATPWSPAPFPEGKRFAFTIMDDTDVATVSNVRPVYELLHDLGLRTTKTVWAVPCPEGSPNFSGSETLADPKYLEFVRNLAERGFEVAFHGATMESSRRERTLEALETIRRRLGTTPRVHANHALNRENLYWGVERFDDPLLRTLYRLMDPRARNYYCGHVPGSEFWWGDLAARHITYCRNLTFTTLNLCRVNPTMPYRDPQRPDVPWWFSGSDAEDCSAFNALLRDTNQNALEAEGGVCIVATHFGKGFARDGRVDPETRRLLERLAALPGWFVPVGELLDWLRSRTRSETLPAAEWRRMQWSWLASRIRVRAGLARQ